MDGDLVADILADVVAATRQGSVIYGRNQFHAPWGIGIPAGELASFHVVTAGACWLVPDGGAPIQLTRGDVALVPAGTGHSLMDSPGRPARPLPEVIGGPMDSTACTKVVIDGPGPVTGLLCGGYLFGAGPRHPLTEVLPPVVHVGAAAARGLTAAVELLAAEVHRPDPGADAVIASLVDLLFVYLLRAWFAENGRAGDGWARALRDPAVGRALAAIHDDPGRRWGVAALARVAGSPRATFSRRFTALTGQPPMAYVTAWRMSVAARLLREQGRSVREVASRVGYDSEFAFARAFKRAVGEPPGRFRSSG